jgi:predicted amidohydrolase YtcJ
MHRMQYSRRAILLYAGWAAALILSFTAGCSNMQTKPSADLVVRNAKVWTGDPARPLAEGIAILGDRIVAAGSAAEIEAWRSPRTQVINARGKLVIPGFNDAHVHFMEGGRQLDNVDLRDATTPAEFARRIGERAQKAPNDWILGGDWDEQQWNPVALPTRELIDGLTPSTPVFVIRYDGHQALANSVALRLGRIDSKTPDPPGGSIARDARGNPTGILKDAAMSAVYKVIPAPTPAQQMYTAKKALAYAASLGVTSIQDMNPSYSDISTYMQLAEKGELTTRIYAAPLETELGDQAKIGIRHAFGSSFLRLGAIKGFADGSLGSTTAYFFEPYTDSPGTRGLLADEMQSIPAMRDRLLKGDDAGLQICIHAIGDQAISITLGLFEEIEKAHGVRDRRCRIEHAQHVAPQDFDRFAKLQVIASVQPYHAIDDGRWAEKRIGPERAKTTYAFRTFLNRGVRLALGTDWYVAPLNPMLSVYAAVTRATLDGKNPGGWIPEQRLTVEEAVSAYTAGSAYAEFQEEEKGTITAGKLADLVILSRDILRIDPSQIRDVKVETTIVGGRIVFQEP